MTGALAALFADKILRCVDRIIATLDGLPAEQQLWAPPAPAANSLAGIANHVLSNLEENVFGVIEGGATGRDRSGEFAPQSADAVRARWIALRPRVADSLDRLDDGALSRPCRHPRRGTISIGEMLMVMLRHFGEHEGEAMITRSLAMSPDGPGEPAAIV